MSGVSPAELASAARKQKKAQVARKTLVNKGKVIKEKSTSKLLPTINKSLSTTVLGPAKQDYKHFYVCEHCPAVFNRRYNRDRHVDTNHNALRKRSQLPETRKRPQLPKLVLPSPKKAEDLFTVSSDEKDSDNSDADDEIVTMDEEPVDEIPPIEQEEKEDNISETKDKEMQVPTCRDPNTNLIQLPLCKEVAVTIFVTSK